MSNVNDEIRARLNAFVTELSAHVRETTLRNVAEALKSAEGHSPARRASPDTKIASAREVRKMAVRKPGRPAKAPVATAPAAQPPVSVPASLAQLMARIHGYIKANPGQGVTPIATSLGTSNQDLRLPIRMLVDENKITSTGKTRGTRYFPR
jgi:hypothetical protein